MVLLSGCGVVFSGCGAVFSGCGAVLLNWCGVYVWCGITWVGCVSFLWPAYSTQSPAPPPPTSPAPEDSEQLQNPGEFEDLGKKVKGQRFQ